MRQLEICRRLLLLLNLLTVIVLQALLLTLASVLSLRAIFLSSLMQTSHPTWTELYHPFSPLASSPAFVVDLCVIEGNQLNLIENGQFV